MTLSRFTAACMLVHAGILIPTLAPANPVAFPVPSAPGPFVVERFETGPREIDHRRFFRVGGAGATDVRRDDFLRFAFTGAVEVDSLNERTVRISAGIPVPGEFLPDIERRFDAASALFVASRDHRRRVLFDPTGGEGDPAYRNPAGFAADTLYTVILPGTDEGAAETVKCRDGRPLARTFRTTFRTGSAWNFFFQDTPDFTDGAPPTVESIEASDAPGVPLAGRTDVDPRASILVHLSGPVLRSSFDPLLRIRNLREPSGRPLRFRGRLSEDGTTCEFRPRRPLPAGGPAAFYLPGADFAGRSGRYVVPPDPVEYVTVTR